MSKKQHRGRPPKYVLDDEGRPVVGLSYDTKNNVYFNTHFKSEGVKKERFSSDRLEAIFLFRQWEEKRKGAKHLPIAKKETGRLIQMRLPADLFKQDDESEEAFKQRITKHNLQIRAGKRSSGVTTEPMVTIPETFIWAKARELILKDITEARKQLNLPIRLDGTYKDDKSITLMQLQQMFFEKRRKPLSRDYKRDGLRFWREFVKVLNIKMVSQITPLMIEAYEDWVYSQKENNKWSSSSVNNRFDLVKAVFGYCFDKIRSTSDKEHLRIIRDYMRAFTYAETPAVNPVPITKEHFRAMLDSTNDRIYRAVMLVSLNCGMKESGVVAIRLTAGEGRNCPDINLKEKTLAMPRPKTGIIRVAMLWERTVDAIEHMLSERTVDSEYLFLNKADLAMKERNISKWWARQRKRAGVPEAVKFEHIRDATQTVPLDDNPGSLIETNLIMGHAVKGMANNYLERRPNMVRRACRAIEEYFFP
ncbi:MAG: tyrosine-type recombinase/integrase [Sedimentisphaerales bacterium]|nr:tyrosine-type recombinase/integrase [Sedimentisphaerales bacterium]